MGIKSYLASHSMSSQSAYRSCNYLMFELLMTNTQRLQNLKFRWWGFLRMVSD